MLDNHFIPNGFGIMPAIHIFGMNISSYTLFVSLALICGLVCFALLSKRADISKADRLLILLSALTGGILGSKIPIVITRFNMMFTFPENINLLYSEKSIVGGLIGGFLGVLIIKKIFKIKIKMGNDIAPAAALGMAIGRLGCFFTGCCYGKATGFNFGINFGDGILRHPTQLYEFTFNLILFAVLLYLRLKTEQKPGALFKVLVNSYLIFRFFNEFLRDTQMILPFLTYYQLICVLCLIFFNRNILINIIKKVFVFKRKEKY